MLNSGALFLRTSRRDVEQVANAADPALRANWASRRLDLHLHERIGIGSLHLAGGGKSDAWSGKDQGAP